MGSTNWVALPGGMKVEDVPLAQPPCRIELQPGQSSITALGPFAGADRRAAAWLLIRCGFQILFWGRTQYTISIRPEVSPAAAALHPAAAGEGD